MSNCEADFGSASLILCRKGPQALVISRGFHATSPACVLPLWLLLSVAQGALAAIIFFIVGFQLIEMTFRDRFADPNCALEVIELNTAKRRRE